VVSAALGLEGALRRVGARPGAAGDLSGAGIVRPARHRGAVAAAGQSARAHREQRALLHEAAEAFRIALFHRACAGLSGGHDGTLVDPARLTKYEQTVLKSVFRTVVALLEFTERRYLQTRG